MASGTRGAANVLCVLMITIRALAHDHHEDNIPEGEGISPDPIDSILWIHIFVQIFAWGIVFPTGMVLGLVRSRWHVPVQTLGTLFAIAGYFLGHKHGGRQFAHNIHSTFAISLGWMLAMQILIGIYLKLHLEKGILGRVRPYVVIGHGVIGKLMPVASWLQMLFGGITAMGYCRADHLGQCLAHFIMGSAFIGYGIVLTILLVAGQAWIRRTGRSQEFFDSIIIAAWGSINTFTEHRWGGPWVRNDLQHTSMGVVWWCAGLLGIWLSRKRDGKPKRNLWPAFILILTGWGMSAHPQHNHLSGAVHTVFGYTLMGAGAARIVEIAFVLKDKEAVSRRHAEETNSFQYLTPFLLYASGLLFMGATEEQMALLSNLNVTHVSYILLLYSIAFLLFLYVCILLTLYANHTWPLDKALFLPKDDAAAEAARRPERLNGHAKGRGVGAEEFELEGLMSEDEAEGSGSAGATPSELRRKEAMP